MFAYVYECVCVCVFVCVSVCLCACVHLFFSLSREISWVCCRMCFSSRLVNSEFSSNWISSRLVWFNTYQQPQTQRNGHLPRTRKESTGSTRTAGRESRTHVEYRGKLDRSAVLATNRLHVEYQRSFDLLMNAAIISLCTCVVFSSKLQIKQELK